MKYLHFIFALIMPVLALRAQSSIDVTHYTFRIEVNDRNDSISGEAAIDFTHRNPLTELTDPVILDLRQSSGKAGLTVYSVSSAGKLLSFEQKNDRVIIEPLKTRAGKGSVIIKYSGIPADGLIISKNKFGHRTFFSDNWPDRAHQWIPCVDSPSDKASVTFIVVAPDHYKVISNGTMTRQSDLPGNRRQTEWNEPVPLPTKVMVIGIADFATEQSGVVGQVPVTSWVFPENRENGFRDYNIAPAILLWMQEYIGRFPYAKLAHVQSKTIFGGMENAGAIFYYENSVNGRADKEALIAHETAHQFFGDMVTEEKYSHVWLSEGFATYMSHLFIGSKYGQDSLRKEMIKDRKQVTGYSRTRQTALIDSTSGLMDLLNINSYQKGSWVLHMLRCQTGDSLFRDCIRQYYKTYAGKNVVSSDLRQVFESVTGKSFRQFFDQWLYVTGQPDLTIQWSYNNMSKNIVIVVNQEQDQPFTFPLKLELSGSDGTSKRVVLDISKQTETFNIPWSVPPTLLKADPDAELLHTAKIVSRP